jgi:hypothetical protein
MTYLKATETPTSANNRAKKNNRKALSDLSVVNKNINILIYALLKNQLIFNKVCCITVI